MSTFFRWRFCFYLIFGFYRRPSRWTLPLLVRYALYVRFSFGFPFLLTMLSGFVRTFPASNSLIHFSLVRLRVSIGWQSRNTQKSTEGIRRQTIGLFICHLFVLVRELNSLTTNRRETVFFLILFLFKLFRRPQVRVEWGNSSFKLILSQRLNRKTVAERTQFVQYIFFQIPFPQFFSFVSSAVYIFSSVFHSAAHTVRTCAQHGIYTMTSRMFASSNEIHLMCVW